MAQEVDEEPCSCEACIAEEADEEPCSCEACIAEEADEEPEQEASPWASLPGETEEDESVWTALLSDKPVEKQADKSVEEGVEDAAEAEETAEEETVGEEAAAEEAEAEEVADDEDAETEEAVDEEAAEEVVEESADGEPEQETVFEGFSEDFWDAGGTIEIEWGSSVRATNPGLKKTPTNLSRTPFRRLPPNRSTSRASALQTRSRRVRKAEAQGIAAAKKPNLPRLRRKKTPLPSLIRSISAARKM